MAARGAVFFASLSNHSPKRSSFQSLKIVEVLIVNVYETDRLSIILKAGGPLYEISKGTKDGRRSKIENTIGLPSPASNSTELIQAFGKHGFTVQDLVALSGAHTLGVARCSSFKNRMSNFNSTNDVDPTADSNLIKTMSKTCVAGDNAAQPFDRTWNTFDNNYFKTLQRRNGLLTSDQTLHASLQTRGIVNAYAVMLQTQPCSSWISSAHW